MLYDRSPLPRPPNAALLRALWSLLDGIWGVLKGSWGVLVLGRIRPSRDLKGPFWLGPNYGLGEALGLPAGFESFGA